jgi:hypothetical protein
LWIRLIFQFLETVGRPSKDFEIALAARTLPKDRPNTRFEN